MTPVGMWRARPMCSLLDEEHGQTVFEYALILALVALGLVAAVSPIRDGVDATFASVVQAL
jgi:Flp pilus assembly pilin Flp